MGVRKFTCQPCGFKFNSLPHWVVLWVSTFIIGLSNASVGGIQEMTNYAVTQNEFIDNVKQLKAVNISYAIYSHTHTETHRYTHTDRHTHIFNILEQGTLFLTNICCHTQFPAITSRSAMVLVMWIWNYYKHWLL